MTTKTTRVIPGTKMRDAEKMAHIPIQIVPSERETMLRKPKWLRIKPDVQWGQIKSCERVWSG